MVLSDDHNIALHQAQYQGIMQLHSLLVAKTWWFWPTTALDSTTTVYRLAVLTAEMEAV